MTALIKLKANWLPKKLVTQWLAWLLSRPSAYNRLPSCVGNRDEIARFCRVSVTPTRTVPHAQPHRHPRQKRAPRKQKAQAAAISGPAIVTVTCKRDRNRRREAADDNTEASPELKAFFARMMRPRDA
jgi:hypothetical protein